MYAESQRQRSKDHSSTCSLEIPIYNSDQDQTSDHRHGRRGNAHEHNPFIQRDQSLEKVCDYQYNSQERNKSIVYPDNHSAFKSSFEDTWPNNIKAGELREQPMDGHNHNSQRMSSKSSSIRNHFPPLPPLPNEHKRDVNYNRTSDERNFHGFDDATFFDDLDLVTKLSEELGTKMSFDNIACHEEPQPYMPMHEHHGEHLEYSDDENSLSSHEDEYDAISLHSSAQRKYAGRSRYNSSQPFNPVKSSSEGYARSEVGSASSYNKIPLQKMNNRSNSGKSVFSGTNSDTCNYSPSKRRSNVKQESFLESPTKRRMSSHHSSTNELLNQDVLPRESMLRRVSQSSVKMYAESQRQRSKDHSSTCSLEIPIYNSDQDQTSDHRHGRRGNAHEHNPFIQRDQSLEKVCDYQYNFQERNKSIVYPDNHSAFKSSFEDTWPNNIKAGELREQPMDGHNHNSQRMSSKSSSIRNHFPPLPPLPNEHKRDVNYNRTSDERNFHLASAEVPFLELDQEENVSSTVEKDSMHHANIHESLANPTKQFCDKILPCHASLQKKSEHESKRSFLHGETLPGPSNGSNCIPPPTIMHCRRSSAPMMRNPEYCLDFDEQLRMSKSCHSDHGSGFDDATFFDDLDLVTKLSEELGTKMSFDNVACHEEPQPYMPMHEHHGEHLEYSDDENSLSSHEDEYDAISLHSSAQRKYAGRSRYNSSQPFNPVKSSSEGYARSEVGSASSYNKIPLQKMNNRSNSGKSVFSGTNSDTCNYSPSKRRSNVKQESLLESPTKRRMSSHHSSTNELLNQDVLPRESMLRKVSQSSVNLFDEKKSSNVSRPTETVNVELSRKMKKKMEERVQNLLQFMDATDWTRDELGRLERELNISREDLLSGRKLY